MSSNNQRIKRPDVAVRDKKLDTLNVQLKKIDTELSLLRKQIDQHQLTDSAAQERKNLQNETREIIKTQAELKSKRNAVHDSIKQLDASIKKKSAEVQEKLGKKAKYSSVDDAKQRIAEIEDAISTGDLTLVEEKLLVKEMNALNKLMKDLKALDPVKKSIEDDKAKIVKLKEQLTALNPREYSSKFEEAQQKLNEIQSKSQGVYDKRQALFQKRTALYAKRDEIYSQIRKIRADFDNEFKAYKSKMEKERLKREEENKLSKLLEEKDNAMGKLQEKLNHAQIPAFTYEIEAIENTLVILDPSYTKPKKDVIEELKNKTGETTASADISMDINSDGLQLISQGKKDDEAYSNTAPSKSKKYKKKAKALAAQEANGGKPNVFRKVDGKLTLEPTLIATLAELDVSVPLSADDLQSTIDQLKSKHEEFTSKQSDATAANIKEIEDKIAKLELDYKTKEQKVKEELEQKRLKEKEEKEEQKENTANEEKSDN